MLVTRPTRAMALTLPFDLHPGQTLTLLLLEGVTPDTLESLRARVQTRALQCALLDPALIPSPLCVHSAASRALLQRARGGRGVTDSLHVDLVYMLHAGKSVSEALRALGPKPGASTILLAALGADAGALHADAAPEARVGSLAAYYAQGGGVDAAAVQAIYRVADEELRLGCAPGLSALEAAVLGRVGSEP